ncbi:MAG: PepSY domain-containing protein [Pseudomonadota bacterium]
MNRSDFLWLVRKLHYWAGWGLGIFALSWFGSGSFMTLKPIEEIRGSHIAAEPAFDLADAAYSLPALEDATSVTLIDALGTPAFVIRRSHGRDIINAATGEALPDISEDQVRDKAMQVLKIESDIAAIKRLETAPMDYAGPLPVWQVTLTTPRNARLYMDAMTGQLVRVRTTRWRWFDIAWRIHILDVSGENFNSWWLKLASGLAALFAISGFVLLWRPRRRST